MNTVYLSCNYYRYIIFFRNVTAEEWEIFTKQNIERAAKEINSARPLRAFVDTLLKQVIEDLWNQCNTVNEAFRRRIEETKEVKTKLEIQHSEVRTILIIFLTFKFKVKNLKLRWFLFF